MKNLVQFSLISLGFCFAMPLFSANPESLMQKKAQQEKQIKDLERKIAQLKKEEAIQKDKRDKQEMELRERYKKLEQLVEEGEKWEKLGTSEFHKKPDSEWIFVEKE